MLEKLILGFLGGSRGVCCRVGEYTGGLSCRRGAWANSIWGLLGGWVEKWMEVPGFCCFLLHLQ